MNNSPANRQDFSPLGFANLENVAINNHLLQPLDNQFNQKSQPLTINSTLSPLLNQLSLKTNHSPQPQQQISPRLSSSSMNPNQAYIRIVEQPARCALRFRCVHLISRIYKTAVCELEINPNFFLILTRYECEGRSAGSIPGCNSTADNKTYPTIEIVNYNGPAVVVVSCITKDQPFRPHPHNLVGKDGCKKGICTLMISNNQMRCTFTSLGIQCVKKKDIEESLRVRESIKVDPFRTGFSHGSHATIDLNVVRLCFQVFIEGNEKEKFNLPLQPVVSDPIYDKKAMSDLNIVRLSHCSASIAGGQEVILLCDRITKDDVQVKFYEEQNNQIVWESLAEFQPNDVHKQCAIVFRVPKYYQEFINQPVTVYIQLRRPSDNHLSEVRQFQYTPNSLEQCSPIVRKRQKFDDNLATTTTTIAASTADKKRSFDNQPQQLNEFRVPRLLLNPMQADETQSINALQPPSFFMQQADANSPIQQTHSPDQYNENSNFASDMMPSFTTAVKSENSPSPFAVPSHFNSRSSSGSAGNRFTFGQIKAEPITHATVKTESLELDIDANDLISDINFNNMQIMMGSDNNITFNSSGNIKMEQNTDLQSPNTLLDISNIQQNNQLNF